MMTRILFLLTVFALWAFSEPGFADDPPRVRLETSLGNIELELYPDRAPITVANFLQLVDDGFYQGLIFHRVIANFMIQGGGFDSQMGYHEAPATIVNESSNGLLNRKRYVAMARTDHPDSAGAQFFVNVRRNPHLDGKRGAAGYAVFGKVIEGWDVVEEIELSDTGIKAGMPAVPDTAIVINSATLLNPPDPVTSADSESATTTK
jgi:peptidyl-prolyl cis-trans isomerase A (cyclophilin A)